MEEAEEDEISLQDVSTPTQVAPVPRTRPETKEVRQMDVQTRPKGKRDKRENGNSGGIGPSGNEKDTNDSAAANRMAPPPKQELEIITVNVNGIRSADKALALGTFIAATRADIYVLTDTHTSQQRKLEDLY